MLEFKLTGELSDGTQFEATDCVTIVGRGPRRPGPDIIGTEPVLKSAYPNPFNPVTRISYELPREEFVDLSVYDVTGRLVERLVARVQPAGEHVIAWDAKGLPSGIYFYRLVAGNYTNSRKVILLK